MNFQCFQQENFCLLLIKHILLKKEHDLLFFQLFVSKHFYEYFFLILMYVFVTLKSYFFDFGFKTFKNFFKFEGFFHSKLLNTKWKSTFFGFFWTKKSSPIFLVFFNWMNKFYKHFWITNWKLC
jgi:hypothetical protein